MAGPAAHHLHVLLALDVLDEPGLALDVAEDIGHAQAKGEADSLQLLEAGGRPPVIDTAQHASRQARSGSDVAERQSVGEAVLTEHRADLLLDRDHRGDWPVRCGLFVHLYDPESLHVNHCYR